MKQIFISLFSVLFLASCGLIQKPQTVYNNCPSLDLPDKPKFRPYNVFRVKYENDYYYCLTLNDAKILLDNWINFKVWSEEVYIKCYLGGNSDNSTRDK